MGSSANNTTVAKTGRGRMRSALRAFLLSAFALVASGFAGEALAAYANVCVADAVNPVANLVNVTNNSYCELCGYGYVEVTITNPYHAGNAATGNQPSTTFTQFGDTYYQRNLGYGSQNPALHFGSANDLTITLTGGLEYYNAVAATGLNGGAISTANNGTTIYVTGMNDIASETTLTVRVYVHRRPDNTPESLNTSNPTASASINYSMTDGCNNNPGQRENNQGATTNAGATFWQNYAQPQAAENNAAVNVRRPVVNVFKQGWNVDAGQTEATRSDTVFGHDDDDVVWRLNISNSGNADLQDLRIDDVLARADVMNANYVCPTAAAATAVANNNGVLPAGSTCVATQAKTGTILDDWDVKNPFGAHANIPAPYAATVNSVLANVATGTIDVPDGGATNNSNSNNSINLYVVGKIQKNASCSSGTPLTNTLQDVQFGCAVQPPVGGIASNKTDNATLKTWYGQGPAGTTSNTAALSVTRTLTGIDGSATVGMRGLMTIVLSNQSGGTVWFDPALAYHLQDTLPAGYVVDPSYTPWMENTSSLYGGYNGRVDRLSWINPHGAIPGVTSDSTSYLDNTAPQFKLSSSTTYTENNPDAAYNGGKQYANLMRHGDVVVIRFAVIVKDPKYFDRAADLDVTTEDPSQPLYQRTSELSDPNDAALAADHNSLSVLFKTLCDGQGTQDYELRDNGTSAASDATGNAIAFKPEDLDIHTVEPTFIMTNDTTQHTILHVLLSNNGGVAARDFGVYVTFGATINVVGLTAPNYTCSVVNNWSGADSDLQPSPDHVWVVNPAPDGVGHMHMPLKKSATDLSTTYLCIPSGYSASGNTVPYSLAAGASVTFTAEINKTTNAAAITQDDVTFRADVVGTIWTVGALTLPANNVNRTVANSDTGSGNITVNAITVSNAPSAINNAHPEWFPAPGSTNTGYFNQRSDGEVDQGNLYSLDAHWSRGIGFNLLKDQVSAGDATSNNMGGVPALGVCSENTANVSTVAALPQSAMSDNEPNFARKTRELVQIGEECTNRIQSGGWFGFQSRGFSFIGVDKIQLQDKMPNGQAFISSTVPLITSQIAGATQAPNSPTTTVLGETSPFGWSFTGNQVSSVGGAPASDYIVTTDQWFTINADTRILNKPQNQRAAPDVQAADLDNVLDANFDGLYYNNNTGKFETYNFGNNTVGYPWERIRRADVVVTEPQLTIVKQVCDVANYTAGANGGTCANGGWKANLTGADTAHQYIFRLALSNCATANSQNCAPAYDATVIDTLDPSDLMTLEPMESDGIDNDGDGVVDATGSGVDVADEKTADSVNDNLPHNGTSAVVTFSYKRSAAGKGLHRIDPGSTLYLYYIADPDQEIAPGQTMANNVVVTAYDSLDGGDSKPDGNQTVTTATVANGDLGGARVYPASGDTGINSTASLTFITPSVNPKQITALSVAGDPIAANGGNGTQVKIGEEVQYTLTAQLPVVQLKNLTVIDNLPAGLSCSAATQPVDLSKAPYAAAGFKRVNADGSLATMPTITPTCTATAVEWDFGNVSLTNPDSGKSTFTFPLSFVASVNNVAANVSGKALVNGNPATTTTLTYVNASGATQTYNFGQVSATVVEPRVALQKTWNVTGKTVDGGDIITVTVTATNSGNAPAYNLNIRDALLAGMDYLGNVAAVSGTAPTSVDTTTYGANSPVFKWAATAPLAANAALSFTYQIKVDVSVQPLTALSDFVSGDWTSLPNTSGLNGHAIGADGSATGMRNGNIDGVSGTAPNTYQAVSATVQTTVPALVVSKTDNSTAVLPEIGAHKQFSITVKLPEGTTSNLVVTDALDSAGVGYVLEKNAAAGYPITYALSGIASINGKAVSNATAESAMIAAPANGDTSNSASWTIGTVVTNTEDDLTVNAISPQIVISYWARIDNDAQTNKGSTLQNTAKVDYASGQGGAAPTLSAATATVTAIESQIPNATKTVAQIESGQLTAGDHLKFVISFTNSGNATAYDLDIKDVLPAGLALDGAFTPTVTGTTADSSFVAAPQAGGGVLAWGRDNGSSLNLAAGGTLTLTYQAVVQAGYAGTANTMTADWTSLAADGSTYERSGSGNGIVCDSNTLNDYCVAAKSGTTSAAVDTTKVAKAETADTWSSDGSTGTDAKLRLGDTATFTLTLTLNESTTHGVTLTDTLPAGMDFVAGSATATSTNNKITYTGALAPTVSGTTGTNRVLSFNLGDVTNANTANPTAGDTLVIAYQAIAVVAPDAGTLAQVDKSTLQNTVKLGYTVGGSAVAFDPAKMQSQASVEADQPVLSAISKTETSGKASGVFIDNLQTDVMHFRLSSSNNGAAPAYSLKFTDTLDAPLDETSIKNLKVTIGGTAVAAGATGYTYTAPTARGGSFTVVINAPVPAGQVVNVDYDIGFHTDVPLNQTWNNTATINEYWSLPNASGQKYAPTAIAQFQMQNKMDLPKPLKALKSPATKATIGEAVVYTITIPGSAAVSAQLDGVTVNDTLDANLVFDSASVSINGGAATALANTGSGQNLAFALPSIPANQQAVVTLNTHVANTANSNAGNTFKNSASYTYSGVTASSDPTAALTVAEPQVTLAKSVDKNSGLSAGSVLTYTLTLAAKKDGNNTSDAHDLVVTDTLDAGLGYVANSAKINGTANEPTVNGQVLTWNVATLAEAATLAVTYQVQVQASVGPGQTLNNHAKATWTSLAGGNANERTGTQSPAYDDYVATATTQVSIADTTTFAKSYLQDTWSANGSTATDGNLRVGDRVQYKLHVGVQEGTTKNVVVTDTLPTGLKFARVVGVAGNNTNVAAATNSGSGQTVIFNLGNVVDTPDGNAANDYIDIVYEALVQNGSVLTQTPTSQTLANNAKLGHDNATGAAAAIASSADATVLQPLLAISAETATTANGGDTTLTSGEIATYTVTLKNNGNAPAYDVQIQDVLPAGERAAGVTTQSIGINGTALANVAPSFNVATGVALWDLDAAANAYTIPAGGTLTLVYTVTGDAGLGAGLTLKDSVTLPHYYSFDNGEVPANGVASERQDYSLATASSTTLTTPVPGALAKAITQTTAAIGEHFAYRITVPATPSSTALYDVRILDDLTASAAKLKFVSVAKAGTDTTGTTWTPVNTGTATNLVIADGGTNGIDIPAGKQAVLDVVVELADDASNVAGLTFHNTAHYSYDGLDGNAASQASSANTTSADMSIVAPNLTLAKTGPGTLKVGDGGAFVLNVQNTGTSRAWDITLKDVLPDLTPGGMRQHAPVVTSAQVFAADGTTAVGGVLAAGTDYTTAYDANTGTLTFTGLSANAAPQPNERLIVKYTAQLDDDSINGQSLTNIAGATQWFSADTDGSGAGDARAYDKTLTDGTVGTLDFQDALTLTTQAAILQVQKTVVDVTSGANPGSTAKPGDKLRYTITVTNTSDLPTASFTLSDDLGALNASLLNVAGALKIVSVPAGADTSATQAGGGSKGAGLLNVANLQLAANASLKVVFETDLAPVIDSGSNVLNQAKLLISGAQVAVSDDPNVNGVADPANPGNEDPTRTTIVSKPAWKVQKTSQDLTGDPNVLEPGDTLRYTITVQDTGSENAKNVVLRDALPQFTHYVAASTRLNGNAVADVGGASVLASGLTINAPGNTTAGVMESGTTNNVATITFDVTIDAGTQDGTIISNQGFVNGGGAGNSGAFAEAPSDDPNTAAVDDPTRNVVGDVPLIVATKTVAIQVDNGTKGSVDPGDTLRYTIVVDNNGASASNAKFVDAIPANTTYVAGSSTLNGAAVADAGGSAPWVAGSAINAVGQAAGSLPFQSRATITFDVKVNAGVAAGTIISNQGKVQSTQLANTPTDADGNPDNGYQPTTVVVGSGQQLLVTKQVSVVGGGAANPGAELEYVVTVTNQGAVAATHVKIVDDLNAASPNDLLYVANSAVLDGNANGVSVSGSVITADYAAAYGDLAAGASATLRFRATLASGLAQGTHVTNTGTANWNDPAQTASASASFDVGGTIGVGTFGGHVWHDGNLDNALDANEAPLADWTVALYSNGELVQSVQTDATGAWTMNGVVPNSTGVGVAQAAGSKVQTAAAVKATALGDALELRFTAPNAAATTAKLGYAHSAFSNDLQRIYAIKVGSGSNLLGLDLPVQPDGVVYESMNRGTVTGAKLTLVDAASKTALPNTCFADSAQQGQVTLATGFYRFDVNFSDASCPSGGDYLIQVAPPSNDYLDEVSELIPPTTGAGTAAFNVPTCAAGMNDAVPGTTERCEATASASAPGVAVAARSAGTTYYLRMRLDKSFVPGSNQIYNNHIPLDLDLGSALSISKTTPLKYVNRGQLVPYTITLRNISGLQLHDVRVVDAYPAGFKYVPGSARLDGKATEPVQSVNARQLTWSGLSFSTSGSHGITLLLAVGAGVGEGEFVNYARSYNGQTNHTLSGQASATVRVVPDPTFDCTDIIGKVYDDANRNGLQDRGEKGLGGVRVIDTRGIAATTDAFGRYHITCAVVPNEDRGSNYVLKLDDRTLPSGYRPTTRETVIARATRGKALDIDFGASIYHVVSLDLSDEVFEQGKRELRPQWQARMQLLRDELLKQPAILRLSYLADVDEPQLVQQRLDAIKAQVAKDFDEADGGYELKVETQVFWRRGAPVQRPEGNEGARK